MSYTVVINGYLISWFEYQLSLIFWYVVGASDTSYLSPFLI